MGKKEKNKAGPGVQEPEKKSKYQSLFFKDAEWLDQTNEGIYLVNYNGQQVQSTVFVGLITEKAYELQEKYNFNANLFNCYSVQTAYDCFMRSVKYSMTNEFAKIWLDKFVQAVCDGLCYTLNAHFMRTSNLTLITDVRHKAAVKLYSQLESEFLIITK